MDSYKVGKASRQPKGEAAAGLMSRQDLRDGQEINHKYRRGVTGKIRLKHHDWQVLWSDGGSTGGQWETLHSGDVG